jgi:hypothetical protein
MATRATKPVKDRSSTFATARPADRPGAHHFLRTRIFRRRALPGGTKGGTPELTIYDRRPYLAGASQAGQDRLHGVFDPAVADPHQQHRSRCGQMIGVIVACAQSMLARSMHHAPAVNIVHVIRAHSPRHHCRTDGRCQLPPRSAGQGGRAAPDRR